MYAIIYKIRVYHWRWTRLNVFSQFFSEATEKHTIIFNYKKIYFFTLFIFLHNVYRDYIPPSGRRAQPERSQSGA